MQKEIEHSGRFHFLLAPFKRESQAALLVQKQSLHAAHSIREEIFRTLANENPAVQTLTNGGKVLFVTNQLTGNGYQSEVWLGKSENNKANLSFATTHHGIPVGVSYALEITDTSFLFSITKQGETTMIGYPHTPRIPGRKKENITNRTVQVLQEIQLALQHPY